jgi:shikimate kinase
MGTGKSIVARALSKRLEMKLLDTDELIESNAGMKIKEIFASQGEARFRELETETLEALVRGEHGTGFVLSTGGGIVIDPANRESLKALGVVVCLKADKECILERIRKSKERPLLEGDAEAEIEKLLKERSGFYEDADIEVDTTEKSIVEVVETIVEFLDEDS